MSNSDKSQNKANLPDAGADALATQGARTPGGGKVNPFSQGRRETTGGSGGVNPSGPTTGTEGWGLGASEGKATGSGQGSLGKSVPDIEKELSHTERDDVPLGERTFRCADAGNADCRWETSARTDDDLMGQIERHGREAHGITNFDDAARRKILDAVKERRAA